MSICFAHTHTQSGEERHVTHMQYVDWPDHGEFIKHTHTHCLAI